MFLDNQTILILVCIIPSIVGFCSFIDTFHHRMYTGISLLGGITNLILLSSLHLSSFTINFCNLHFSFDGYGYLLAILMSISWIITSIYSHGYLQQHFEDKRPRFYAFLSITISTVITSGFAHSIITLLIFYTMSSVCILYLLQTFKLPHQKIARTYIISVILPPLLGIIPLGLYYGILYTPFDSLSVSTLHLSDIEASLLLALIIVLFSKNCVMPFHTWLPESSFAPAPLSALVHTAGAVQTGIIAIVKIARHMYSPEYLVHLNSTFYYTGWISYLCGATALYTAYCAWRTTNLKKRFSYSTVGQLSYIISAILLGTNASLIGALLHIITHSFAKISLFFSAGILSASFSARSAKEVNKVISKIPWLIIVMSASGLSIAGVPFFAGFHSKDLMLLEEMHTKHFAAALFLLCGSFVNLLYIYPILKSGITAYVPKKKHTEEEINEISKRIHPTMKYGTILSFSLLLGISIFLDIDSEGIVQFIFEDALHIQ